MHVPINLSILILNKRSRHQFIVSKDFDTKIIDNLVHMERYNYVFHYLFD
uniref:Uncharacterized protein n=1 Tax=Solanum lycopersicum TaxID=4081 RepID=A0A3Q7EI45_SOLLC